MTPSRSGDRGTVSARYRPRGFDASTPNSARIWNYWLGGKDNFAADRELAEQVLEAMPSITEIAWATRQFLVRAVQTLVADYGIRQFLDIGSGLPTADNTHEVAQRAAPESRIVYVDYDPVVLVHARALLTSSPEGATHYVQADLRDTGTIIAETARTLDLTRPVAILLLAVLHFIPDADDPYLVVRRLMDAVPPGSFLAVVHGANDIMADKVGEALQHYNTRAVEPLTLRTREQVCKFFGGLELIGPGMVTLTRWGYARERGNHNELACYGGIARKAGSRQ